MTFLLIILSAFASLIPVLYLAASAVASRWLTPREWLARTLCKHQQGRLLTIEFDGEAVYECMGCGKHIRRPL